MIFYKKETEKNSVSGQTWMVVPSAKEEMLELRELSLQQMSPATLRDTSQNLSQTRNANVGHFFRQESFMRYVLIL